MSRTFDWLISVDDHLMEPADLWRSRLPRKYWEIGPRLVPTENGEVWAYEDKRVAVLGLQATVGKSKDEYTPEPISYADMQPGCYDPIARVKDMDQAGILAQACFPSFPRFCGQVFNEAKDKELALLGVQAWNDFILDEWCAAAPGRFIPLVIVPLWDPQLARQEVERTAAKGAKGVIFSENVADLGLPSIHSADRHWDPMFAAANEASMPICAHIGSSSKLAVTSADAPSIIPVAVTPMNAMRTMYDFVFSGLFFRFPNMKLVLAEGEIGWMPFALAWMDRAADRQRWAWEADYNMDLLTGDYSRRERTTQIVHAGRPPSDVFREHVFGCFIEDAVGLQHLDLIGEDNVMIETDYPHSDTSWPESIQLANEQLQHCTEEQKQKILIDNACRVFSFTPAVPPVVV